MSGGSYEYFCFRLEEISEQVIERNDHQPTRQIIAKLLAGLGKIMHDVEWYDSSNYGEDAWEKVENELKKIFSISKLTLERTKKLESYEIIEEIIKEKNK